MNKEKIKLNLEKDYKNMKNLKKVMKIKMI